MHTSDWWLSAEKDIHEQAMLAPFKIFLDECSLTSFSSAKAFPALLECANIVNSEQALFAFIPVMQVQSKVRHVHVSNVVVLFIDIQLTQININ
jgi:hypothetical protein